MFFSSRRWLGLARIWSYSYLFWFHFRFGKEFNFLRPGLEAKFACETAEKIGAKLEFLGSEMNQLTWQRLKHETRVGNIFEYAAKCF